MSDYEKRWHVSYGQGQHLNYYTDDLAWVVAKIDEDPDAVVCEGGARDEYIGSGHREFRGIEGTLFTRYERRRGVPHDELRTLLEREQLRDRLIELMVPRMPPVYVGASHGGYRAPTRADVLRDGDVMRDIERVVDASVPAPESDPGEVPDWVYA